MSRFHVNRSMRFCNTAGGMEFRTWDAGPSRITELQEFRFHIICHNSLVYCNLLGETPVFSLKKHENSECGKESVAAFSYRWETAGFSKPAGRRTDAGTGWKSRALPLINMYSVLHVDYFLYRQFCIFGGIAQCDITGEGVMVRMMNRFLRTYP